MQDSSNSLMNQFSGFFELFVEMTKKKKKKKTIIMKDYLNLKMFLSFAYIFDPGRSIIKPS